MASAVFLRAVNVGGHKTFKPSALVSRLADLEVTSLGAAGTFVVRAGASASAVRERFEACLPFEAGIMICPARDLLALVAAAPFADAPAGTDAFVSVLERAPRRLPALPHRSPAQKPWQVSVMAVHGSCVVSVLRRSANVRYPNEVVEKLFGLPATTRGWATILKLAAAFESEPAAARKQPGRRKSR